jgi:hypothetical protein
MKFENMFKKLLGLLKINKQRLPALQQCKVIRLCPESEDMNDWQKTDVIINITNCPFATLTESKIPNIWYHHDDRLDYLFTLKAKGFYCIKGSKSYIKTQGLLGNNT